MAHTPPSTPPPPSTPSPLTNNTTTPTTTTTTTLSDIFSSSPPSSPSSAPPSPDHRRLQTTHTTAGYRAGIATSKALALQPGFDEGYTLGATFGLRVGYLLGVLEGLRLAFPAGSAEKARMEKMLERAGGELAVERVFGGGGWGGDGVWGYDVRPEEGGEVTFREVVGQHPVVRWWGGVVEEEIERAGVGVGRFEGGEWEGGRVGDEGGEG